MLTLVSIAPPSPGPGRAAPSDTPSAMAEAFLDLLAEDAPEDAQEVAIPPIQNAQETTAETEIAMNPQDKEEADSPDADTAMTIFLGLPMVNTPPPLPSGTIGADVQTGAQIPAAPGGSSPVPPDLSGQVAPLTAGTSRLHARPVEAAKQMTVSALSMAAPTPPAAPGQFTEAPVTEDETPSDGASSVMESAARFRLGEAAEALTDAPSTTVADFAADAPTFAVPATDVRADVRQGDSTSMFPHKQAARHLTGVLAETGAQLATHANRNELTLAPEELGRIKFDIRRHGDSLIITMTADRPETLDLMRRHANDLRSELAAAGYGGATLDFAGSGNSRESAEQSAVATAFDNLAEPDPALPEPLSSLPQRLVGANALDLRL